MNNSHLARSIRVFIVAEPLTRWGLERLVQGSARPACELAGTAAWISESDGLLKQARPDMVVLAADLVPTEDVARLCEACEAKVLLVTGSHDESWLDSAVIAGVRGVVRTGDAPETLLRAIDCMHRGELWLDRGATGRIFVAMARHKAVDSGDPERSKIATLTLRERQTIAAVASDAAAPGKVIANRLCISEHTLRNHLTSIYSKLGLSNRVDLYAYATRYHLNELR